MITGIRLGLWNAMRLLRVVLGLLAVTAGIVYRDSLIATLGAVTFLQGLFNISCCGVVGCAVVPQPQRKTSGATQLETKVSNR
jgi:hypothetical protein